MAFDHLPPEQAARAAQIRQVLQDALTTDLDHLAEALATTPDSQLLGSGEFAVQDRVHAMRAKGLPRGRVWVAHTVTRPRASWTYRPRTIASVLGPLRIERAYYHCKHCHRGSPRILALGQYLLERICRPVEPMRPLIPLAHERHQPPG